MAKIIKIKLSFPHYGNEERVIERVAKYYKVQEITDSTEFTPKQLLTKETVDNLCAQDKYTVVMVPRKDNEI